MTRPQSRPLTPLLRPATVDLDEQGRLLVPGTRTPVPETRVAEQLARDLRIPRRATDVYVYVHGWQTSPAAADRAAGRLITRAAALHRTRPGHYPGLSAGFRPWCVVVRWPSSSLPSLGGYRRIRDRAHAMSARGQAGRVLGHLLGYLDQERGDPAVPGVLANRNGQYLHLVGHSFGGRFLCEAVQYAADRPAAPQVLGWSRPADPRRPFTVDSMLVFQMAAPRNAFEHLFPRLFAAGPLGAPLRGPLVLTHSRFDRATGFWHLRAEGRPGIGHSGVGAAPIRQFSTSLRPTGSPYPHAVLDHPLVNINADDVYRGGRAARLAPAGAHSDFQRPESAHLLLSLAAHSR
ncbi:alpha/beta hydrolase [Kitasatospora viridis]|nr:alpha/beta hydrolase [Kitasatospora viridis]